MFIKKLYFGVYIDYDLFVLVRGCRPGKTVHMSEGEIRALCHKSREIFLSQPILLELEAPLKICGRFFVCSSFIKVYSFNMAVYLMSIVIKLISSYSTFNVIYESNL